MKYPLLMGILPCIFIGSFAGAGMGAVAVNQLWVGVLKFTQPEGLIPQLIGLICGIPVRPLACALPPLPLANQVSSTPRVRCRRISSAPS